MGLLFDWYWYHDSEDQLRPRIESFPEDNASDHRPYWQQPYVADPVDRRPWWKRLLRIGR